MARQFFIERLVLDGWRESNYVSSAESLQDCLAMNADSKAVGSVDITW